jgi:hypothetical protein
MIMKRARRIAAMNNRDVEAAMELLQIVRNALSDHGDTGEVAKEWLAQAYGAMRPIHIWRVVPIYGSRESEYKMGGTRLSAYGETLQGAVKLAASKAISVLGRVPSRLELQMTVEDASPFCVEGLGTPECTVHVRYIPGGD